MFAASIAIFRFTKVLSTHPGESQGYVDCQGYVMSLAVLPVFRCVARQLLQHALQKAFQEGAKTVKLHVHTQNLGAIRL